MDSNKTEAKKTMYVVESAVSHGRPYEVGDEIELTDVEAKSLLEVGSVSLPKHASREAMEAPKQRAEQERERQKVAAREAHDAAQAEHEAAEAAVQDAQRRLEDAKSRVGRTKAHAATLSERIGTWEADANRLGGDQLSSGAMSSSRSAQAPAHGGQMTPSTPTKEATKGGKFGK